AFALASAAFCIAAAFAASGDGVVLAAEVSAAGSAAGGCSDDALLSGEAAAVPVGAAASFGASMGGCAGGLSARLFESVVVTVSFGPGGNNILYATNKPPPRTATRTSIPTINPRRVEDAAAAA